MREPCVDCGTTEGKWRMKGRCDRCHSKAHYAANRDKAIERARQWYKSNKDRAREISRKSQNRRNAARRIINPPRTRYEGPCIVCGATTPGSRKYFLKKMCFKCYKIADYAAKHPRWTPICHGCEKPIASNRRQVASGLCAACRQEMRYAFEKGSKLWYNRSYYSKNPHGIEIARAHARLRRARLLGVNTTLTVAEWRGVISAYGNRCAYCGCDGKLEMDHVVPLSKGGTHSVENVVPACRRCNSVKSNRLDFRPPRKP